MQQIAVEYQRVTGFHLDIEMLVALDRGLEMGARHIGSNGSAIGIEKIVGKLVINEVVISFSDDIDFLCADKSLKRWVAR